MFLQEGYANSFYQFDVVKNVSDLCQVIRKVDLIIPTTEDIYALKSLNECASKMNIPLAHDEKAHFISRSKKRSNRFLERLGISLPHPWPQCGLPVIAKPSSSSGSRGVNKLCTEDEVNDFIKKLDGRADRWVLQEYLDGPSYSLEVLGLEDHFEVLQITELEMDHQYDCKRVLTPARISESLEQRFKEIAVTIAKGLSLKGIMDVEVICHQGILKVLEIDARLPSQTPTAVYQSTGINMLELIGDIFVKKSLPSVIERNVEKGTVYEHIRVSEKSLELLGEHIMTDIESIEIVNDFFGADESLTNFNLSRFPWVATLIITGENREHAWLKHFRVIENIKNYLQNKLTGKCSSDGGSIGCLA